MKKNHLSEASYQSFIKNYTVYRHKIFSYLYYRTEKNKLLAEDLTSETFTKAYEKYQTYKPEYAFSTWVFTIARNTFWNHLRDQKEVVDSETVFEKIAAKPAENFLEALDQTHQKQQLHANLNTIKLSYREVIILKYMRDWTTQEIADHLGTNPTNIRQRIARGMNQLKKIVRAKLIFICI